MGKINLTGPKLTVSPLAKLAKEENEREEEIKQNDQVCWLLPNLVIKCVNRDLGGGKYYGKYGLIRGLESEGWAAKVQMIREEDGREGDLLLLDQEDCETCCPRPGGRVTIVRGEWRGREALIVELGREGALLEFTRSQGRLPAGTQLQLSYSHFSKHHLS